MKILHISSARIDYLGGTEKVIWEIARRQSKKHEVTILQTNLYEEDKKFKGLEVRNKIKIITVKNDFFLGGFGYSREFKKVLKNIWREYDIIHIHGHGRFTSTYALGFLNNKKPIIYSAQGFFHNKKNSSFKKIYDFIFGGRLKNASFCTALTELEKEKLLSFNISPKKIAIIPGGVNFKKVESKKNLKNLRKRYLFDNQQGKKILLYVGRVHESKGIQHVITAIKDLDLMFFIVGRDSGYCETLKSLVKEKGVEKKIRFFGSVSEKELSEIYQISDVFVLYSYWEGF